MNHDAPPALFSALISISVVVGVFCFGGSSATRTYNRVDNSRTRVNLHYNHVIYFIFAFCDFG